MEEDGTSFSGVEILHNLNTDWWLSCFSTEALSLWNAYLTLKVAEWKHSHLWHPPLYSVFDLVQSIKYDFLSLSFWNWAGNVRWSPVTFIVTEWMTNLWSHANWHLMEALWLGCTGCLIIPWCARHQNWWLAMLKIISFSGGKKTPNKQKAKKEWRRNWLSN